MVVDLEAQMANVRVALDEKYPTTNDPADQIEVLAGSLRDAGMKSLDHCM